MFAEILEDLKGPTLTAITCLGSRSVCRASSQDGFVTFSRPNILTVWDADDIVELLSSSVAELKPGKSRWFSRSEMGSWRRKLEEKPEKLVVKVGNDCVGCGDEKGLLY